MAASHDFPRPASFQTPHPADAGREQQQIDDALAADAAMPRVSHVDTAAVQRLRNTWALSESALEIADARDALVTHLQRIRTVVGSASRTELARMIDAALDVVACGECKRIDDHAPECLTAARDARDEWAESFGREGE